MTSLRLALSLLILAATLLGTPRGAGAQIVDAFDPNVNGVVNAIAVQPDGKILIGGAFTSVGGTARHYIARLNPDGSVDPTFNPGADSYVTCIAVQPDGKILVGGYFTALGGGTGTVARLHIGRLNADGSVDLSFDPGASGSFVTNLVLQTDGKILVGGVFSGLGGGTGSTPRHDIGRLMADGTVDAGFDAQPNGPVVAIAVQPDGKILVGGSFNTLSGVTRRGIGRVEPDGSLDMTFDPGANSEVQALAVQPDGKILVGGVFTTIGGGGVGTSPRLRIARLNSHGAVDSFNPGASSTVRTIVLQADGRILLAGLFTFLGAEPRNHIGRLMSDGLIDTTFDPGSSGGVYKAWALAIQPDGKVLVGGGFSGLGGGTGTVPRANLGRVSNTEAATGGLTVSPDGSAVTWTRGGTAPESSHARFSASLDGVTYTPLGEGVRVAGGWQLGGLALPPGPSLRIRAQGAYASGLFGGSMSAVEIQAPPSSTNIINNPSFDAGVTGWSTFALPDSSGMTSNVTSGVFQFYRTGAQAVVLQRTFLPIPADAVIEATFRLGNTAPTRRRISVLVHDDDFSDLSVCTFWLPANSPLRSYGVRARTTKAWTGTDISFYAADVAGDGFYQVDDVSVKYEPAIQANGTTCTDPLAPPAAGGAPGPNWLTNGDFGIAHVSPWITFGAIASQISSGVFEFVRTAGQPAGVVLQATAQSVAANDVLTATFALGNSSSVRKRVTVLLHDLNFTDLSACTFWMEPGQSLAAYEMRAYTTKAWGNATLSVYPSTVGIEQWILLDNATFQRTPSATIAGTTCVEPGSGADAAMASALASRRRVSAPSAPVGLVVPEPSGAAGPTEEEDDVRRAQDATDLTGWVADGFERSREQSAIGADWLAVGSETRAHTLTHVESFDLTTANAARLYFESRLVTDASRAEVQTSLDGVNWATVHRVRDSDSSALAEIDLRDYLGGVVYLRFVLNAAVPLDPSTPDRWHLGAINVEVE